MQNISIHANKPKRSVESLIEDSAIDNPDVINFEVLEMKKAYNQTYKSFNIKVQGLESEVAKYKEKCKKLEQANVSLVQKCIEFQKRNDQLNQMKLYCEKMKRKLLYVEGKYEKLFQNRSLVQQTSKQRQSFEKWKITKNSQPQLQKADRNQVYKQISNLISAKVKQFTKEIRLFSMPKQLEIKIQTFLEELIYITPVSGIDGVMMKGLKEKQVGRLITKDQQNFLLSEQKVWKQITGLPSKNENNGFQRTVTPGKKQNLFNQQLIRNTGKRNRSPLSIYNNDDQLGREKKNSSRPKAKIFTDI